MKIMSAVIGAIIAVLLAGGASSDIHAPASPYAGQERRPVKALSPKEAADLEAGRGMGSAKVAELNRYPGPKHVLELGERLALTGEQTQKVKQIHAAMEREAQRVGKEILTKEAELEKLFAERRADETTTRALVVTIGQLQGELRFAHVNAHLATARVLSPAQVTAYDRLRGYAGGERSETPHQHRH